MFTHCRFTCILPLLVLICASQSAAQSPNQRSLKTITVRTSEGTDLGFDLSADGRSIVFDLLGQLWLFPAQGGKARPITDAVRDAAEDLDPSFAPDGRSVLFRGERNGRTGLWLLSLDSGRPRQLTQLPDPDGFDGKAAWSPDGRLISFTHAVPPDATGSRWRTAIMLLDVASGSVHELSVTGIPNPNLSDPIWVRGGRQIAFISRKPRRQGGRIWIVDAAGGAAKPVTADSVQAQAPTLTSDGRRMAYLAPDSKGRTQVWVQELESNDTAPGSPKMMTNHKDVTATRIRWDRDGNSLLYSADGRLWKVAASGGQPKEIRFNAELSIRRSQRLLPPARFPEPGRQSPARGFMGLAVSPDAGRIAALVLGKLWIIPVGGTPRALADVPFNANSIAWSPDGAEVAWVAGVPEQADLFATDLTTGTTRRVTALPGREANPAYSPDGRHLAFIHLQQDEATLRVVEARASNVADATQTRSLGSMSPQFSSSPQWSPESDGLLVSGAAGPNQQATFVPLSGAPKKVTRFPNAPIFLQWTQQHTILFVRHDRLWQAPFDHTGMLADPQPIGNDAALYASSSRDGTLLFVSDGGLRLRSPNGEERRLGWPISYTPPMAEAMLIRNVRIVDGTGGPITPARDILIERGRIARIAPSHRRIPAENARVINAGGRIIIPGLMDLHAHTDRPDLLPGFLYFGVTTVRDQGSSMAPTVAYADDIAAGLLPGPRVGYGGFQFYSDYSFDSEQWQGIEPEADPEHIKRAVDLAEAFGAQHIKTRTFRRWDINARMIAEAHRRGMRATGHCSHLLPLVAAGMDAKEHIGLCEPRGNTYMYDDLIQLFRATDIGVVPTICYLDFAVRLNERPTLLDQDAELAPFLPARDNFDWMFKLSPEARKDLAQYWERSREATAKLWRAGVTIGTGTDIWQIPTGVHMELEQLVAAGLTSAQAIRAGTAGAARILGAEKDLGTIEVGKRADLIILDADPLVDIRNTRRIWQVVHNGGLVDRAAILKVVKPR